MTAFAALDILIVDDHETMRTMLARAMKAAGAEHVRTAENGWQALALLASQRADLILSDHNMPDMDGLDLVRALRRDPRHAKAHIIMLTGQDALREPGRAAGADAVLIKPVAPRELLETIEQLLS